MDCSLVAIEDRYCQTDLNARKRVAVYIIFLNGRRQIDVRPGLSTRLLQIGTRTLYGNERSGTLGTVLQEIMVNRVPVRDRGRGAQFARDV